MHLYEIYQELKQTVVDTLRFILKSSKITGSLHEHLFSRICAGSDPLEKFPIGESSAEKFTGHQQMLKVKLWLKRHNCKAKSTLRKLLL
jgi:hypothetical protein